ncbi:MAG: thiamine phosphate synthase [Candidatus Omnitrophica bacterium]|nr:thiamine phosphate synthase [Candidatus Omnitrophota bacterium]
MTDWKERAFRDFCLYAVTDLRTEDPGVLEKIERAYRGGADVVQLRGKGLPDAALIRLGEKIRKVASRSRKLFIVNDRVDLALAVRADGVHLGQEDVPVQVARGIARRSGQRLKIGKSVHDIGQAVTAVREGADLLGVGPVFATPTKPCLDAVGLDFLKQVSKKVRIPWVAIGGIDLENLSRVLEAGATRVAVVRAIFAAKDPAAAAARLKKLLKG